MEWLKRLFKGSPEPEPEEPQVEPIEITLPDLPKGLYTNEDFKIFVEGVIWNIYSYDQWGVELGKVLADRVLEDIQGSKTDGHDASTTALLKHFYSKLS
jgi:glucose-6-phosphate isomerase